DGYIHIVRQWKTSDHVQLKLDMPVERVRASDKVKFDAGRVALQRGPIVYCLEGVDNASVGGAVRTVALPSDATLTSEFNKDLLGGVVVIRGAGIRFDETSGGWSAASKKLYEPIVSKPADLVAVPYYAWDNRAPGEMTVWIPESLTVADRPL